MSARQFVRPAGTPAHRFDPRAKIVLLLAFLVLFFLPVRIEYLAAQLALVLAASSLLLGFRSTLRPIRLILPILVLVLLLTPPFNREGRVLIAVRHTTILSTEGLLTAVRLILRFSGITVLFFLFVRTTEPEALILAFRWFGLPFTVALVLSIAVQYIPTIRTIYDQVQDAHRLRLAADLKDGKEVEAPERGKRNKRRGHGGFLKRMRAAIPVITSVLILSVRRIPTLAMALECRGVGRVNRRTTFRTLKGGAALVRDGAITLAVVTVLILSLVLFP